MSLSWRHQSSQLVGRLTSLCCLCTAAAISTLYVMSQHLREAPGGLPQMLKLPTFIYIHAHTAAPDAKSCIWILKISLACSRSRTAALGTYYLECVSAANDTEEDAGDAVSSWRTQNGPKNGVSNNGRFAPSTNATWRVADVLRAPMAHLNQAFVFDIGC